MPSSPRQKKLKQLPITKQAGVNQFNLIKTDSGHPDFIHLVKFLDAELAVRDGEEHDFYAQFNKIDKLRHVVLAYENNLAVACGALKEYADGIMEVKRMYTLPGHRGKGLAIRILSELEGWAKELGYSKCILETGKKQPEAIALYAKCGYQVIPNYGQYAGVENSICFEKNLTPLELRIGNGKYEL
jgi:GNAT superfamily N-acetyltransferase